jgi:hypothetical protein
VAHRVRRNTSQALLVAGLQNLQGYGQANMQQSVSQNASRCTRATA